MRKRKKRQFVLLTLLIGIVVFIVILNVINQGGFIGGNWTVITASFIEYLPPILGIGIGFTLLMRDSGNYSTTPIRLMIITGIIGVCFSWLFYELYIDGIWVDEIVTATFTITDLQIITIMFSLFYGVVIGLIKR